MLLGMTSSCPHSSTFVNLSSYVCTVFNLLLCASVDHPGPPRRGTAQLIRTGRSFHAQHADNGHNVPCTVFAGHVSHVSDRSHIPCYRLTNSRASMPLACGMNGGELDPAPALGALLACAMVTNTSSRNMFEMPGNQPWSSIPVYVCAGNPCVPGTTLLVIGSEH